MRKLIMLAAAAAISLGAAGSAVAGQGATSSNGNFIDLSVRVTPPIAGTPKSPRGVGVAFDSFDGNRINGNTVANNTTIKVRFARGFTENGLAFPGCKISFTALSKCTKSTQVGTGSAEAELAGSGSTPPTFVPATLAAYNGKPYKGAPSLIFIASVNGKPTTELAFTATQQAGALVFSAINFPGPPSVFAISKFSINIPLRSTTRKVHGKSVKVNLIDAPNSCHGSWSFSQTETYTNSPTLTATDSEPCVKG
jgi:hypothetical protein